MTFVTASGETSLAGEVTASQVVAVIGGGELSNAGVLSHSKITPPNIIELVSSGETSGSNDLSVITKRVTLTNTNETSYVTTPVFTKVFNLSVTSESSNASPLQKLTKHYLMDSSGEKEYATSKYSVPFKTYYGEFHISLPTDIPVNVTSN